MNISSIRTDYVRSSLSEDEAGGNPMQFFDRWLGEAISAGIIEPTAMALSTISETGIPSTRIVLLKGSENGKLRFYTNYDSDKGRQLKGNPAASLLFFWPQLERQVRFGGYVHQISGEESDAYFYSRPFESRVGAVVSQQSRVIGNREELDRDYEALLEKMRPDPESVRRPENWGGYEFDPVSVEFWQGRASRLHDRIRFRKVAGEWVRERLSP